MVRHAARLLSLVLLCALCATGCHRASPSEPPAAAPLSFVPEKESARILLVVESDGPGAVVVAHSAAALRTLLAHFDERCEVVKAEAYESGKMLGYACAFYLAGQAKEEARTRFGSDLARHQGTAVWVGSGVADLGDAVLADFRLEPVAADGAAAGAVEWTIAYGGQQHGERITIPSAVPSKEATVLASATRAGVDRPFISGRDKRWYAAAGPTLEGDRFWSACVWADALHEILGRPHSGQPRRLLPVLRDVPVWARENQVPDAIRPMLGSGLPVAAMAWTNWGEVPLADRPEAVKGLRESEAMGATVVLVSDSSLDPREHLRLAWEVGLHPVAWAGPAEGGNPFSLRVASHDESPPFCAGGVLPAPTDISDAGLASAEDSDRLRMVEAVRDGAALISFSLWAPPQPFQAFLREKEAAGWMVSDMRDLGFTVTDERRTLVAGVSDVLVPEGARVRETTFSPRWEVLDTALRGASAGVSTVRIAAPERGATAADLEKEKPAEAFIRGVTLDPWAYSKADLSSRDLAEMLAERYERNDINTVFFYAYNVGEGAAYRTRYRGAGVSEWGRQDLLAHLLEACHARGIRVVAWLYSGRDEGMWKKHSEWREREKDGRAHNPLRLHAAYFLCPRNPEVQEWYAGLLKDLAHRYPTLDGIELCEPVVNWFGDQACYCDVCRQEFAAAHPKEPLGKTVWRQFRAQGMTDFLSGCMKAVSEEGVETYVMTISDAWSNGAILSPRRQAEESGFDLEALLNGPYPPDWVNFEIIWQQWAAIYGTEAFNYDWAEETARRLVKRTDGRARVVLHVELTDFGSQRMTPAKMAETIARVKKAGPDGIECYHSAAIDKKAAWPVLSQSYEELP